MTDKDIKNKLPMKAAMALAGILISLCSIAALISCTADQTGATPILTSSSTASTHLTTGTFWMTDNNSSTEDGGMIPNTSPSTTRTPETTPHTGVTSVITDSGTRHTVTTHIPEQSVTLGTTSAVTTEVIYTVPEIDPERVSTYTVSTETLDITIDAEYTAKNLTAYELSSDSLLYTTDMFKRIYPASTTKIVTALYALYVADPDDLFTVGDELSMVARDASVAKIKRGQKISLEHLIYAMLLPSGNDAAYTVAANVGRIIANDPELSAEKAVGLFMEGMNKYARYIGMTDSNFTCPDGYHNNDHYTTLHDMLIATKACCDNEFVMQVASTPYIEVKVASGQRFEWSNSNYLLGSEKLPELKYEGTLGLKTGYTSDAGACIICVVQREDVKVALLYFDGESKTGRFEESAEILDCVFEYFEASEYEAA